MTVKRDSVNRKERVVCLPIALDPNIKAGDTIVVYHVQENEIVPEVRDPMADGGFGYPDGSNPGDAVFDAKAAGSTDTVFDAMQVSG